MEAKLQAMHLRVANKVRREPGGSIWTPRLEFMDTKGLSAVF
jgi:hypothetical protein